MTLLEEDTGLLLDLLREAADEPVTLDELEVVGVRDPARALFELELAGHAVSRVVDRAASGRRVACVRLGPPPAPAAPAPPAPPARAATAHAPLLVVALGLLLALLGARFARRRAG